jgi:hypothetical protein
MRAAAPARALADVDEDVCGHRQHDPQRMDLPELRQLGAPVEVVIHPEQAGQRQRIDDSRTEPGGNPPPAI